MIEKHYSGLQQKIDNNVDSPKKATAKKIDIFEKDSMSDEPDVNFETPTNTYWFIHHCIDPNQPEYKTRLLKNVIHTLISNQNSNYNNKRQRL